MSQTCNWLALQTNHSTACPKGKHPPYTILWLQSGCKTYMYYGCTYASGYHVAKKYLLNNYNK